MIGIVSHLDDLHAVHVRRHLEQAGSPHLVLDTSSLPMQVGLTTSEVPGAGWHGWWEHDGVPVDLRDVHAMWWRRPQPFVLDGAITDAHDRAFARGECAAMVAGLWHCLDAEWVNDPDRDEAASRKMWQLRVASELGLRVPRTCMTNDPARALGFIESEPGSVVFKSFSASEVTWRETRLVRDEHRELFDRVRLAPVIFQECIPGGFDIRVTIVGDQVFSAEIRSGESSYDLDFRVDTENAPIEVHPLPEPVEGRLMRMMRRLGLRYGAIDLRRAPDGDYVFLEVNPAGQWLFIELATGQPISSALARLLGCLDQEVTARTGRRAGTSTPPHQQPFHRERRTTRIGGPRRA